ncbi:hypothetical protein GUJ93_ZPchr0013g36015 [Zizania palustris]|uniref:Uncharacterized protein n=1 Tax=Zizania palustris TaxID=103762 RepID=A0A8J6C665_ZIZPA|nr:hypothetical protein GUJ93_ZPchr0013g36015 [Zizania palustris]
MNSTSLDSCAYASRRMNSTGTHGSALRALCPIAALRTAQRLHRPSIFCHLPSHAPQSLRRSAPPPTRMSDRHYATRHQSKHCLSLNPENQGTSR